MYNSNKILALIPARGGSKGIKNKNIINLGEKPLIAYSIIAGLESNYVDDVIVSTDSLEIAEVAKRYGAQVPFIRPSEYAQDNSKTIDAVLHAISFLKSQGRIYDALLLLQPTQPLRTAEDIDGAIVTFYKSGADLASVCEVDNHPLLIRSIKDNRLKSLLNVQSTCRRQDMPVYYCVNGCIYINKIKNISNLTSFNDNPVPFIMHKSHSVDIDEYEDLEKAKYYLDKITR